MPAILMAVIQAIEQKTSYRISFSFLYPRSEKGDQESQRGKQPGFQEWRQTVAHYMNACTARSIYSHRLCFSSTHNINFYCRLTKQVEKRDSYGCHSERATLSKVSIWTDLLLEGGQVLNISRGHAQMVHSRWECNYLKRKSK